MRRRDPSNWKFEVTWDDVPYTTDRRCRNKKRKRKTEGIQTRGRGGSRSIEEKTLGQD